MSGLCPDRNALLRCRKRRLAAVGAAGPTGKKQGFGFARWRRGARDKEGRRLHRLEGHRWGYRPAKNIGAVPKTPDRSQKEQRFLEELKKVEETGRK